MYAMEGKQDVHSCHRPHAQGARTPGCAETGGLIPTDGTGDRAWQGSRLILSVVPCLSDDKDE